MVYLTFIYKCYGPDTSNGGIYIRFYQEIIYEAVLSFGMLKWIIALLAATAFVWGLSRVLEALTCDFGCRNEIIFGVIGVALAGLSFAYLIFLFSRVQSNI